MLGALPRHVLEEEPVYEEGASMVHYSGDALSINNCIEVGQERMCFIHERNDEINEPPAIAQSTQK